MQRRQLFRQLSRVAATLAWQQLFAPVAQAQVELQPWTTQANVFTLGVASGEPRPDSVVIWTRLAPLPLMPDGGMPARPIPVIWEVAHDEQFFRIARSGTVHALPERIHALHLEVEGLQPGREYFYRFIAAGHVSPLGRTRTAPAPDARPERLRMALASCQHYEAGHFTLHREMAKADLDLVLFCGDYIYTSELSGMQRVRAHAHQFPYHEADHSLDDYRIHHAAYKLDLDLQANHAAHPWLMVWDDNEVLNDYTAESAPALRDVQAFLRLRTAAYRAYFEHLPISPKREPNQRGMRLQDRYEWGQLAEFWTVDTRQHRGAQVCYGRYRGASMWECKAQEARSRTMLGVDQEDWLADTLVASTRAWKFIVQSTQVSPSGIRTPFGTAQSPDGWDAFPAARERLLGAIGQPRVQDVVLLGGDVHRHVAANLRLIPKDPQSAVVASEIVTSSLTSKGLSEFLTSWMRQQHPDTLHCRSDQRGYVLIDVTDQQLVAEFRATAHPVRPESRSHVQARFAIDRGRPGLRRL
ncbi:MAG: alkaline phosphatase D family protein [Aquabacterium sp.]